MKKEEGLDSHTAGNTAKKNVCGARVAHGAGGMLLVFREYGCPSGCRCTVDDPCHLNLNPNLSFPRGINLQELM